MKKITLFLLLCISYRMNAQVITISAARSAGVGSTVTVRGIASNGAELGPDYRFLQDGTAGILAYGAAGSTIKRGDSIQVKGTLADYNNELELDNPVYTVISSGNTLHPPVVVTIPTGFAAAYQGQLVQVNNVHFTSTGSFTVNGSGSNFYISDGTNTAQTRVYDSSDLSGSSIPTGTLSVVGIMGQYCTTPATGCTTGFQLITRDLNDLIIAGSPPIISTAIIQTNLANDSFTLSYNTYRNGSTIIRYGTSPDTLNMVVYDTAQTTTHTLKLSGLTPGTIYFAQAYSVSKSNDTSTSSLQGFATVSLSSGTIKVYFDKKVDVTVANSSLNVAVSSLALADTLISYLNKAKKTIEIAIYNMDNQQGIITAINNAVGRGVTVRIIGDGSNMNANNWALLTSVPANDKLLSPVSGSAVPNMPGQYFNIMHNKFVVIDADDVNNSYVWTGSPEFTYNMFTNDCNNLIMFQDQSLARNYRWEFNEMFVNNKFGPQKTNFTAHQFIIGGVPVQQYFSPSDNTESAILKTINSTNHDFELCMLQLTRENLADAIDSVNSKGAWSGAVIDDTTGGGAQPFLILNSFMHKTLFLNKYSYLVHDKYCIADANDPASDPQVLTGSHNWTESAQTENDENTVVVHNANIANLYYQDWSQRFIDQGGSLPLAVYNINSPVFNTRIYPNPTSDVLSIYFDAAASTHINIETIDGVSIYDATTQSNMIKLNTNQWAQGIYLVRMTQNEITVTKKVILVK